MTDITPTSPRPDRAVTVAIGVLTAAFLLAGATAITGATLAATAGVPGPLAFQWPALLLVGVALGVTGVRIGSGTELARWARRLLRRRAQVTVAQAASLVVVTVIVVAVCALGVALFG